MPLTIELQDDFGRKVGETVITSQAPLGAIMPEPDDPSFRLVGYVDAYGDTVLNRIQMPDFLRDWSLLREKAATGETRRVFDAVEELARECLAGTGLYLRFIGD